MVNKIMDFIFVVSCVGIMAMLGIIILVMVNSPIIQKDEEVITEQSLSYTDYMEFVAKEESCLK